MKSKKIRLLVGNKVRKSGGTLESSEDCDKTRIELTDNANKETKRSSRLKKKSSKGDNDESVTVATSSKDKKSLPELKVAQTTAVAEDNGDGPYKCEICDDKVDNKCNLGIHIRSKHVMVGYDTFTCDYCGYCCKRKYDIVRHISRVHLRLYQKPNIREQQRDFRCADCSRTFNSKATMKKHIFSSHMLNDGSSTRIRWKRGYCCDLCGEGFMEQKEMLAHRYAVHENAVPLKWSNFRVSLGRLRMCEKCARNYRYGKSFDEHECDVAWYTDDTREAMKRLMEQKPCYKCDICFLSFQWKWLYRQHRENGHANAKPEEWESLLPMEIAHYCASCWKTFEDENWLEEHDCQEQKEKLKSFTCDLCGSSYCRKSDYKRHIRFKHVDEQAEALEYEIGLKKKSTIKCPYCETSTATRSGILLHIREAHNIETDTPFVCVPCNKVFKRKATMDTHNQVYHPKEENTEETSKILKEAEILLNGELAYHCGLCNRNMFNAVRFIAHYRLHYVERKFTCDLCGKQTRTQHQLNSHIKFIHLNVRNYECDICGKSFHAKQSCEEHRRIHTGERPFSCEICGKTFVAMNALFTHKKFHNDFYAHPCSMCPKKFKVRRSLINHIRTHTGERPFKCELCPKTFNNSSRFSYHKKVTHSDARPFTCSLCGSCFKANKFLMRHMKLHNVRTHIQFRRRNNPAYFEAQNAAATAAAASGKASQHKEEAGLEEEADLDRDAMYVTTGAYKAENGVLGTSMYSFQRAAYDSGTSVSQFNPHGRVIDASVAEVANCAINDTKPHFLSDVGGQGNFVASSVTNANVERGLSSGKHITCL